MIQGLGSQPRAQNSKYNGPGTGGASAEWANHSCSTAGVGGTGHARGGGGRLNPVLRTPGSHSHVPSRRRMRLGFTFPEDHAGFCLDQSLEG